MHLWVDDLEGCPLRHQFKMSLWKRPVSWKRAEPGMSSGGKFYMRKNNKDKGHQYDIRAAFTRAAQRQGMLDVFPWPGHVVLCVYSYFRRPQIWYAGKQVDGRPDVDNLGKQVMDALLPDGKGGWGAYHDDCQVLDLLTSKRYGAQGDNIIAQFLLFDKAVKPLKAGRKAKTDK